MKSVKWVLVLFVMVSMSAFGGDKVSADDVKKLVGQTCKDIQADKDGTIKKIIDGVHPYKNKDNAAFYVFVYDKEVSMVAHPKKHLVGKNYKGKPDVKGNKFRDKIVNNAVSKGPGWVFYSYSKPGTKGIFPKKAYHELCGDLIVVSGIYAK